MIYKEGGARAARTHIHSTHRVGPHIQHVNMSPVCSALWVLADCRKLLALEPTWMSTIPLSKGEAILYPAMLTASQRWCLSASVLCNRTCGRRCCSCLPQRAVCTHCTPSLQQCSYPRHTACLLLSPLKRLTSLPCIAHPLNIAGSVHQ